MKKLVGAFALVCTMGVGFSSFAAVTGGGDDGRVVIVNENRSDVGALRRDCYKIQRPRICQHRNDCVWDDYNKACFPRF